MIWCHLNFHITILVCLISPYASKSQKLEFPDFKLFTYHKIRLSQIYNQHPLGNLNFLVEFKHFLGDI